MPVAGRLALLGAPLRSSLLTLGTEGAATPLRSFAVSGASLAGVEVADGGDIAVPPPGDSDVPAGGGAPKNHGRVRDSLLLIASKVAGVVRERGIPVVFGGDATALLGLLAGIADGRTPPARIGLVSLDAYARFLTPKDSPAGDVSTMVLALALGKGDPSLARLARDRFPLVQETDVLLAGVREATPAEAAALVESKVTLLTPDRLRGAGGAALFMGALGRQAQRTRELVLQLDVSVLDSGQFPVAAAEPLAGGLTLGRLRSLAEELATWNSEGTIGIVGVSISGVDARKDPGGVRMHELASFVLRLLGRKTTEPG